MTPSNDDTKISDKLGLPLRRNSEFLPGQMLNERYQIVSKLGQGGMGLVYKVNQVLLNKEFALKTIEQDATSPIALRRFQQEARAAFALDHPNIIAVKEFGVMEDQTPFLVMELVNGETLGDRIKRSGPISWEQAIPIFVQICFGLAYAHECGIVHRDIKPGNIMLLRGLPEGADGSIKILDFGIAKLAAHEGGEIQALTRTGEIFGSPMYMSPEQCAGFAVDHRADIYSLGCVFYEALTGAPPCVGENALSTMMKHQNEIPMTLKQASMGAEFPQGLEDIVATMLAKSPDRRYQSVNKVANDLGALKRGASLSILKEDAAQKQKDFISMSRSKFYLTQAGLVVLTVLLTVIVTELVHSATPSIPQTTEKAAPQGQASRTPEPRVNPILGITRNGFIDGPTLTYSNPIRSTIVKVKGEDRRQFLIPDVDLGYISNLNAFGMGPGKRTYQKFKTSTKTTLPFPTDEHLTLEIGGNSWRAIANQAMFKQIDKTEFYGLKITAHKQDENLLPLTPEDFKNVEGILAITKSWNNLESLEFNSFPLTPGNVRALNALPKLNILSLDTFSNNTELLLSKQPFLKHLKFLHLHSTQKRATVHDVLKSISGSSSLKSISLENIELSPTSMEQLKKCANLRTLWLTGSKLDMPTLKAMAEISSLHYVLGLKDTLTDSQLEWLTLRRKDLRFQPGSSPSE